ncbi:MAG: class I adenylate-forming enzyme family protein [Isosphaeraceae bacterium]
MFLDRKVGPLSDLTGRTWDAPTVLSQVRRRVDQYADLGLTLSDRVFLHHGNTLEFFVDLLAIWELGGCAVPVDARLTPFEVEVLAGAAKPRFSVWKEEPESGLAKSLSALGVTLLAGWGEKEKSERDETGVQREPRSGERPSGLLLDDEALILFTSGTTGQPKGVVHTHRSLRARWMSLRQSLGLDAYRRTLCLLPTHFGHGLICNCLFPWLSGQHLFVGAPFRPDLIMGLGTILDQHEITFMSSVPSVWKLALKAAKPPVSRTLKRVFCGSAPLSAALWQTVQDWTGTHDVFNAYGITETGSWLAGTTVPDFSPEDGLIGEAWGGVVRILKSKSTDLPPAFAEECAPGESGYVWVNTPALMRGYLNRDDLTREVVSQGWFVTGDIGYFNDRGYLYLRGREREEINKGGMKVYPGDVDAVVERFAETTDVCTFAFDEPLQGEDVGIAVVLRAADDATLRRLYEWTRLHLAKHQVPQRWYIVDEIPRTSRGKVNRSTVAQRCAALKPVDFRAILR